MSRARAEYLLKCAEHAKYHMNHAHGNPGAEELGKQLEHHFEKGAFALLVDVMGRNDGAVTNMRMSRDDEDGDDVLVLEHNSIRKHPWCLTAEGDAEFVYEVYKSELGVPRNGQFTVLLTELQDQLNNPNVVF